MRDVLWRINHIPLGHVVVLVISLTSFRYHQPVIVISNPRVTEGLINLETVVAPELGMVLV